MDDPETGENSSRSFSDVETLRNQTPDDTATTSSIDGSNGWRSKPKNKRRAVACRSCHSLKVKCTPSDPEDPAGPCVRCINASRKCEIDLTYARKRRKKKDVKFMFVNGTPPISSEDKIKQLEETVKSMQEKLESYESLRDLKHMDPSEEGEVDVESELGAFEELSNFNLDSLSDLLKSNSQKRTALLGDFNKRCDMVSLGIVSLDEAKERLETYRNLLFKYYPFVKIDPETTVEEMQTETPFLLNAVLSISNIYHNSELEHSLIIDNTAIKTITSELLVNASKSKELLKSLLLLCIWYNTPELFKNRRYHLLNGMAVSLIYDIGIINRPTYSYRVKEGLLAIEKPNDTTAEYRSLVMIVFFSAVSICLILRRSIYVKWTPFVEESCSILEKSADPHYLQLALFSRLNHQLEIIHQTLHSNDSSGSDNFSTQFLIKRLQKNLDEIKAKVDKNNHSFMSYYYSIEAYLHEPEISDSFLKSNVENFSGGTDFNESVLISISKCAYSCLNALRAFNNMSSEDVAVMPFIYCARIIYAAGMLMRLRFLVICLPTKTTKTLVPLKALSVIQVSVKLMDEAYGTHKNNYCLMKLRVILQLFIQTYTTQIRSLSTNGIDEVDNNKKENSTKNGGESSLLRDPSQACQISIEGSSRKRQPQDKYPQKSNYSIDNIMRKSSELMPNVTNESLSHNYGPSQRADTGRNSLRHLINNNVPNQSSSTYGSSEVNNPHPDFSNGSTNYSAMNNVLNIPSMGALDETLTSIDDGFWANLLNTDSDKLMFSNTSSGRSNDNMFFMP